MANWMANAPVPPPGTIDQHPVPFGDAGRALHSDRTTLRDGRSLGECQLGGLEGEYRFGRDGVLSEPALELEIVSIDLVTGLELGDTGADGFDPAGDVRAQYRASRRAQPAQASVERRAAQAFPIAEIDRRRRDLHQHLPGRGRRRRDVLDPQDVGAPIPLVHDSLHIPSTTEVPNLQAGRIAPDPEDHRSGRRAEADADRALLNCASPTVPRHWTTRNPHDVPTRVQQASQPQANPRTAPQDRPISDRKSESRTRADDLADDPGHLTQNNVGTSFPVDGQ
ncbi:hypothetical protein LUX33_25560 [Actinomadura madurae]|nr:hypothetical protein [Actinomadura madurae]MCP9951462.1 hypothetical protein [Actinomadura madurae]